MAEFDSPRLCVWRRGYCRSSMEYRCLVNHQITIVTVRSNADFGVGGVLKRGIVAGAADDHIG